MVLISLLGCLKHAPSAADGAGAVVTVVALEDRLGTDPVCGVPAALNTALASAVAARKLAPEVLFGGDAAAAVGSARSTEQRLSALAAGAPDKAKLLIETTPSFYSELSGQYRWTVGVELSLVVPDGTHFDAEFSVPVFLHYAHEGQDDAVAQAAPVIARRTGEMLDIWLATPK